MDHSPEYQATLDYLYSFVDYSLTRSFRSSPDTFDLTRMEALLDCIGNPHQRYPVIHLTGTKGKGSTAAMISSCLAASGYKVGFYTSPHLEEFNERILVDGKMIPDDRLVEAIDRLKPHVQKIQRLTTFELTTAAAFEYFAQEGVDIAVVEVGLGGRLDATNVVNPLVSVITSISYDHMAVLGDTLEKIAFEKAGIIKPNRPVVVAPQKQEALKIVQQHAQEKGSSLIQVGEDVRYAAKDHTLKSQTIYIWEALEQHQMDAWLEGNEQTGWKPRELEIPLLGYHQIENAALAYTALKAAKDAGLALNWEVALTGFKKVFWPCRFEVLQETPTVIVDSAHNRDSALKLRLAIEDYLPQKPVILLFGASEDKDIIGMFSELLPRVREVVVTESIHPRALSAATLKAIAHRYARPAHICIPVETALQKAMELAGNDAAVIAAGSIFIAAGVRQAWKKLGMPVREFELAD